MKTDIGIFRGNFFKVLVRLNRFAVVVGNLRVIGLDQVAFGRRKFVAQVHSLLRKFLGFGVVSQVAVGQAQAGVGEGEIGVGLDGSLKTLGGFQMISLASKFHSFVVAAQSRQGSGRRLERLGTQIGKDVGRERQILLDGLG